MCVCVCVCVCVHVCVILHVCIKVSAYFSPLFDFDLGLVVCLLFPPSRAIEHQDIKGDTPLHLASVMSSYHCLQLLLTKRPDFSLGKLHNVYTYIVCKRCIHRVQCVCQWWCIYT